LGWYELSNWSSSPETRSAHNLAYWRSQDWWGFGPGAHSHIGGVRWWNAKHPTTYAAALAEQLSPGVGRELLTAETRLQERILLESRLSDGIAISLLKQANPQVGSVIAQFIAEDLIDGATAIRGQLVLTRTGRLLADAVVRRILP
jgi:oxygen-independent coproporphyrinogen-3 oxidase